MLINHPKTHIDSLTETFTLPDFATVLPILTARHAMPIRQSTLAPLHDELVAPFVRGATLGIDAGTMRTRVAAAGSAEAAAALHMLTYGYCAHYFTGVGEPQLPAESSNPQFQHYTLVVTCAGRQSPVVLATLQAVVGETVPALSLFAPPPEGTLPHCAGANGSASNALIGELRRFSVNPILDAIPLPSDDPLKAMLRGYRSLIYQTLYELSLRIFYVLNIHFVYGVATPEIYRFFTRSGMAMRPLAGMRLADNDEVRTLQRDFANYWRPHATREQQPALYRIHLPANGAGALIHEAIVDVDSGTGAVRGSGWPRR